MRVKLQPMNILIRRRDTLLGVVYYATVKNHEYSMVDCDCLCVWLSEMFPKATLTFDVR